MRDGHEIAADLSDPELFELWITSDGAETFEEWAEKRHGTQFSAKPLTVEDQMESDALLRARLYSERGGIFYSVEPIR